MRSFVSTLEKEIEKKLRNLEHSNLNVLKKSLEASLVLGDAFQRLREFVAGYTFSTEAEEIEFFKVIKPRLYHRLIYYRKVYNIEMNRPVGVESQHVYLRDEIKAINRIVYVHMLNAYETAVHAWHTRYGLRLGAALFMRRSRGSFAVGKHYGGAYPAAAYRVSAVFGVRVYTLRGRFV